MTAAALSSAVERAWSFHRQVRSVRDSGCVEPSMPILFFGDLPGYLASPVRIVTVGLNPSHREFPTGAPWSRFPAAEAIAQHEPLDEALRGIYLRSLSDYFAIDPYRGWFDRSFEPILRGADASYYRGVGSVALHTDIASPIATNPTWSQLSPNQRVLHRGGAELWRDLVEVLDPDVILISVAREHLRVLTDRPLTEWAELTRVERDSPFVVSHTEVAIAGKQAHVVFGRCVNTPFGSVSHVGQEANRSPRGPAAGNGRSRRLMTMTRRFRTDGDVRFVQFPHPGGEHQRPANGRRPWMPANMAHRRTFLQSESTYRLSPDGNDQHGPVAFWGEWEGEAQLRT